MPGWGAGGPGGHQAALEEVLQGPIRSWNLLYPLQRPYSNLRRGQPDSGKASWVSREEVPSWLPKVKDSEGHTWACLILGLGITWVFLSGE